MNQELTNKLYETYPTLYRERSLPPSETSMCWGFEVGDGWYDLIDRLSAKLTTLDLPDLRAVQVKQKFGSLRFYVNDRTNETVCGVIEAASRESERICEMCGRVGKQHNYQGWIYVACDEHIQN